MAQERREQPGELRPIQRTWGEPEGGAAGEAPVIQWRTRVRRHWGEEALKNLAVAGALVICAVAVRSGSLRGELWSDAVLTAATGDVLLDDQLGRLTFVSSLFPEATLVFGAGEAEQLESPVAGGAIVHAWSEAEPYLSYAGADTAVRSAAAGEVMGVYHAEGEELIIRVRREDGLECCYGNLAESLVQVGDQVSAGQLLGARLPGAEATLEVRRDGVSVDPTGWMGA